MNLKKLLRRHSHSQFVSCTYHQNHEKKIFSGDEHNFISFTNLSDEINNQTSAHLTLKNMPPTLRLLTLKHTYAYVQYM